MKEAFRVIVLDDEPPARDLIEVYVKRMPDLDCIKTCSNAMQGLLAIQELRPDLILLDIKMPEMTGLDLIKLPIEYNPEIIITTAFPEFALASYDYSVLDYLVKPISFDRFVKAIVKFREKKQKSILDTTFRQASATGLPEQHADSTSVWLREEKRLLQIPFSEILFIEGLKDYVKVHLKNQVIITHMSLGKAEKLFTTPQFVRVHRSFIVFLSAVRLIDGNNILLNNGKQLIMGPLYRDELKKFITALN